MFTVSVSATIAIRHIITKPGVPAGAGMRLVVTTDRSSLRIAISPGPHEGDTVYEAGEDAQLFVAEGAEELLRGKTIDALRDDAGRVQFVLVT